MESKRQWMATNRLKTITLFRSLFPGNDKLTETIGEHMQQHGYDESQPIIIWDRTKEEGLNSLYVIDGHTRLVAAKLIGLSRVYVARMKFTDEKAALEYAIHAQRDRRNLTDADLFRCIEAVDRLKPRGGDRKSEKSKGASEPIDQKSSAQETAAIVGTSETKVKKIRSIKRHADDKTKAAILSGKKSIHKAYKETQSKRREHEDSENQTFSYKTLPDNLEEKSDYLKDSMEIVKKRIDEIKAGCARQEWKRLKGRLISIVQESIYYIHDLR